MAEFRQKYPWPLFKIEKFPGKIFLHCLLSNDELFTGKVSIDKYQRKHRYFAII